MKITARSSNVYTEVDFSVFKLRSILTVFMCLSKQMIPRKETEKNDTKNRSLHPYKTEAFQE